jgi:hypothetical protein
MTTASIIQNKPSVSITGEVTVNLAVTWDDPAFAWDMAGLNWDSTYPDTIKGKPTVNITP